jgi:hypothetical protein
MGAPENKAYEEKLWRVLFTDESHIYSKAIL